MKNLSSVIVAKGYPSFILKTIASVENISEEIIIIDIGISPQLVDLLKKNKKIRIVKIDEEVPYVELVRDRTKDFSKTDYVFFLDPDEIVPSKLSSFIADHLDGCDYFKIPRKNIIFDRWIKHSRWWPDYQVRVFKKNKVTWPKMIHRQPKVSGRVLELPAEEDLSLIHHNYKDIDEYLDKAKRYAKYEAKEIFDDKRVFTFSDIIKKSLNEFISRYFASEGYKDGLQGFILAILQLIYYFFVYFYYMEMKQFKTNEKIDEAEFFRYGLREVLHWKKQKTLKERLIKKIL